MAYLGNRLAMTELDTYMYMYRQPYALTLKQEAR